MVAHAIASLSRAEGVEEVAWPTRGARVQIAFRIRLLPGQIPTLISIAAAREICTLHNPSISQANTADRPKRVDEKGPGPFHACNQAVSNCHREQLLEIK